MAKIMVYGIPSNVSVVMFYTISIKVKYGSIFLSLENVLFNELKQH